MSGIKGFTSPSKKRKTNNNKSPVWAYFEIRKDKDGM